MVRAGADAGSPRRGSPDMPRGIAVDDGGNVYITDASFTNFQVFDPNGRLLLAVGGRGSVFFPTFLRMSNANSALCMTGHAK